MPTNSHNTTVYRDENDYYICEDRNGQILDSSLNAEEVLQTSLDRAGDVKWNDDDFICSSGLTTQGGLKGKSETILHCSHKTNIYVPNGYSGGCLVFDPIYNGDETIRDFIMPEGISLRESGTPQTLWDAFLFDLQSTTKGIAYSTFGGAHIYNAKRAFCVNFEHATSWMTTNKFRQSQAYYTDILFEILNPTSTAPLGYSTNLHEDITIQSAPNTSHGFKGMIGNNIIFVNCAVWDVQNSEVPGGVVSAQFMPSATNFEILGGIMMHSNVDDQAAPGQIRWIDGHGPAPVWDVYKFTYETNGPIDGNKTIQIPHNMGLAPDWAIVFPKSSDAATSPIVVTAISTTNITVVYQGKPPNAATPGNQNNLKYEVWCSVK